MRFLLGIALLLQACSGKQISPEPEILPCYKAKSFKEFSELENRHAKNRNRPLTVGGKKYACVESAMEVEPQCYEAKSAREFKKLSREQEKQPAWPIKVGKKYFRCIQRQVKHD